MTVAELLERLEDVDPDAEVRLAIQPSYPFQHEIADVVEVTDDDRGDGTTETVVYIAEAGQLWSAPYLPGHVSRELGWR